MELPSHREADDSARDHESATAVRWGTVLAVTVVAALFVVIVILHLTGVVGPTGH